MTLNTSLSATWPTLSCRNGTLPPPPQPKTIKGKIGVAFLSNYLPAKVLCFLSNNSKQVLKECELMHTNVTCYTQHVVRKYWNAGHMLSRKFGMFSLFFFVGFCLCHQENTRRYCSHRFLVLKLIYETIKRMKISR